ncbi:MAG: hypothetical protein DRI79_11870 [Chloroflexi bacterium]|nr:MAG: hypothetical protein DRI79_11870 [Chloroflexota bacterium]
MKKQRILIGMLVLGLLLVLAVGLSQAQGPEPPGKAQPQGDLSIEATVSSKFSYQGVLKEGGQPVTGSRDMVFRLYSDSGCSTQVGSDIVKNGVQVTDGLFSVELEVEQSIFNGQALWLEVEVGGTKIGCQEILPVPYAMGLVLPYTGVGSTQALSDLFYLQNTGGGRVLHTVAISDTAVWGETTSGWAGVDGRGGTNGVYGFSSTGRGVYGRSDSGSGVYGYAAADSGINYGVEGESNSASGYGVYGHSVSGTGVYGYSDNLRAVHGYSPSGIGVYGHSWTEYGVWGSSGTGSYGVVSPDKMLAPAYDIGNPDVAEFYAAASSDLEAGDVVVLDPAGGLKLRRVTKAYDTTVVGIVSTEPGVTLGVKDGDIIPGSNEGEVPLALVGRVPCKVSAENGPIAVGDLLTTSSTPGHAMRCSDRSACIGAIIGKALEPLEEGTGVILVLVTLQ